MNHPYLPLTDQNRSEMLTQIGVNAFEDLLSDIPSDIRLGRALDLPESLTEMELRNYFLASQNKSPRLSFLGAGAYQHYIPSLVNHLAGRSEFYTAYTPYQPEISQGMLQAIFEYQTFVAELFGLPVANASMYDGASALAEAVLMAVRETRRVRVLVPETINPNTFKVLTTYSRNFDVILETIPALEGRITAATLTALLKSDVAAVVFQNPNYFGVVEDLPELITLTKTMGAIPICSVHPLTLGLLESPGKLGAEIVVGEGQPLGLPVAYGGPYLGLMAASERFLRKIPGRLVGESVDHDNRRAFVLTLQAREQHIRREKAFSNICSNEALCALRAAIYCSIVGPQGITEIAQRCYDNAHYLFAKLGELGFTPLFDAPFFMEFAIKTPQPAGFYIEKLTSKGILPGLDLAKSHPGLGNALLLCTTELFNQEQLDEFIAEMRCLR